MQQGVCTRGKLEIQLHLSAVSILHMNPAEALTCVAEMECTSICYYNESKRLTKKITWSHSGYNKHICNKHGNKSGIKGNRYGLGE